MTKNSLANFAAGGLRKHSYGDTYPLTVSYRENGSTRAGAAYVWDMTTGEELASFTYIVDDYDSFDDASRLAHAEEKRLAGVPCESISAIVNPPSYAAGAKQSQRQTAPVLAVVGTDTPDFFALADESIRIVGSVARMIDTQLKRLPSDHCQLLVAGVLQGLYEHLADDQTKQLIRKTLKA